MSAKSIRYKASARDIRSGKCVPLKLLLNVLDKNMNININFNGTIYSGTVKNALISPIVKDRFNWSFNISFGGWQTSYSTININLNLPYPDMLHIDELRLEDFMRCLRGFLHGGEFQFLSDLKLYNIDRKGKATPFVEINSSVNPRDVLFTDRYRAYDFWQKSIFKICIYPRDHYIRVYIKDIVPPKKKPNMDIYQFIHDFKVMKTSANVKKEDINSIIQSCTRIQNGTMILFDNFYMIKAATIHSNNKAPIFIIDKDKRINYAQSYTDISIYMIIDRITMNTMLRAKVGSGNKCKIFEISNEDYEAFMNLLKSTD